MEKAKEFQKSIYFCFINYTKAFVWITANYGKSSEMGIPDHLTYILRNMYAGQDTRVKTRHGQQTGPTWKRSMSRLYCHPAYLTSRQNTSCKMPDWMKHKLESRLLGEISTTSHMQMIPL